MVSWLFAPAVAGHRALPAFETVACHFIGVAMHGAFLICFEAHADSTSVFCADIYFELFVLLHVITLLYVFEYGCPAVACTLGHHLQEVITGKIRESEDFFRLHAQLLADFRYCLALIDKPLYYGFHGFK